MQKKEDFVHRYGQWALVVGASAGLGAAWAEECAKRGMNLVICARRAEKLAAAAERFRKDYGVEVRPFSVDIAEATAADTIISQIEDLDIGICIYNAAIETGGYFIRVEEKYHMQQIAGNAVTPMRLSYYLCRNMAKKHRGLILLVSSMAGALGTANQASYSGCKAFMAMLAETLWYEMRKYGVTVSGVTVGTVATPNFYEVQAAQGTNMDVGESYEYEDYGFETDPALYSAKPHTPAEVAAYVFEHLEDGPRLFSHPEDEAAYYAYQRMPRKNAVIFMGKGTDKYFSAYDQMEDEFEEIDYE